MPVILFDKEKQKYISRGFVSGSSWRDEKHTHTENRQKARVFSGIGPAKLCIGVWTPNDPSAKYSSGHYVIPDHIEVIEISL